MKELSLVNKVCIALAAVGLVAIGLIVYWAYAGKGQPTRETAERTVRVREEARRIAREEEEKRERAERITQEDEQEAETTTADQETKTCEEKAERDNRTTVNRNMQPQDTTPLETSGAQSRSEFDSLPEVWCKTNGFDRRSAPRYFLAGDELQFVFEQASDAASVLDIVRSQFQHAEVVDLVGTHAVVRLPGANREQLVRIAKSAGRDERVREVRPVFFSSPIPHEGARDSARLFLTRSIALGLAPGTDHMALAQRYGLSSWRKLTFRDDAWLFESPSPLKTLELADALAAEPGVTFVEPQFAWRPNKRLIPNDPMFGQQWHLRNTGQSGGTTGNDMNVETAWDVTQGAGVVIAIADDGVEGAHPDLAPNYGPAALHWDFVDNDPDPSPAQPGDNHGTAVAGVAAARGNNNLGVAGVAFQSTIAAIRLLGANLTDAVAAEAMRWQMQNVHVHNNSWGGEDNGTLSVLNPLTRNALVTGSVVGRTGKGVIYLWAGGNGLGNNDNANYDDLANSRFTIAVSATDHHGRQCNYSEPGACILINATSGHDEPNLPPGLMTTDRLGALGYGADDYYPSFDGTSAAAPAAAGVVALMLAVNPTLTWRDVQHILVNTATINDTTDEDWTQNAATPPKWVNHKYGFGRANAAAAVVMSQNWTNVGLAGVATDDIEYAAPGLVIPDNDPAGVFHDFTIAPSGVVEHVEVVFSAAHPRRGDLRVVLRSPSGTESILAQERTQDTGVNYDDWIFMTVRCWGENSSGTWRLTISDRIAGVTGTFTSAELRVYGTGLPLPGTPTLLSPSNSSTVATGTPTFQWNAVAGATSYCLQADNNATFSSPELLPVLVTTTFYTPANPLPDGLYYWRVRSVDEYGNVSNWSSIWSLVISTPTPTVADDDDEDDDDGICFVTNASSTTPVREGSLQWLVFFVTGLMLLAGWFTRRKE